MGYQFYKGKLSTSQKHTYQVIYKGLVELKESIKVIDTDIDSLNFIIECIKLDNPELFYFSTVKFQVSSLHTLIFPTYEKRKDEILQINEVLLQIRKVIITKISIGNDWDKLLALHDLLCLQIKYANCGDITHSIIGPLIHKIAVCEGISKTFKYLCDEINIDCLVVGGIAKSDFDKDSFENHSWNKVRIDGEWLHVDVTFDLTLSSFGTIRHDYFCVSDDRVSVTHKEDGMNAIKCLTGSKDYYSIKNLVMNTQQMFIDFVKDSFKNGIKRYEVRLPSSSDVNSVHDKVMQNIHKGLSELNACGTFSVSINKEALVVFVKLQ